LQSNLLEWAIPSYDIPLGLNSTAGYGLIAPGMAAAFPGGGSVSLGISIGQVPTINITQQGIAAQALIPIEFVVSPTGGGKASNAFAVIADASFSLEIGVRQDPANPGSLVFNGTLAYLSAHLSLGNSSVGDVSINLLNGLVDIILVSNTLCIFDTTFFPVYPLTSFLSFFLALHHLTHFPPPAALHNKQCQWRFIQWVSFACYPWSGLYKWDRDNPTRWVCCLSRRLYF